MLVAGGCGASRLHGHGCFFSTPLGLGIYCTVSRKRSFTVQVKSSGGELPIVPHCFSQQDDDRQLPSEELSSVAGGIVALGKFDALHIGHRELAIQASKVGVPFLLSFVGMAEVLGWEPRAPIVAKCDRKRVLNSWAPYCGNVAPKEYEVKFSSVRHLSPRLFVEKLSKELGVRGVVAGENYRFGYKAAGDAQELVSLCKEYSVGAYIINSVMDKKQALTDAVSGQRSAKERGQVSSTRVRHALAVGDMRYVTELLGRNHRLILRAKNSPEFTVKGGVVKVSGPRSWLLNLPPKEGLYEDCAVFWGEEEKEQGAVACRVVVERSHVHLEIDDGEGICNLVDNAQNMSILGIEFGRFGEDFV